jgi:hypothetical protein
MAIIARSMPGHIIHTYTHFHSPTHNAHGQPDKSSIGSRYARQHRGVHAPAHFTQAQRLWDPPTAAHQTNINPLGHTPSIPCKRCQTCETLTLARPYRLELPRPTVVAWRRLFALPSTLGLNPPRPPCLLNSPVPDSPIDSRPPSNPTSLRCTFRIVVPL